MSRQSFRELETKNKRLTVVLLAAMFTLVVVVVSTGGTYLGAHLTYLVPIAVVIALIGVWGSYWSSDKLVLRMTGAKIVTYDSAPKLYNIVDEVCVAAGLPMPKIAIVDDPAPNAFATGRDPDHAVVAFTSGMLQTMDRDQIQGVAAHELAHVKNRDTLVMAVAATTAGLIIILSDLSLRMAGRSRGNPLMTFVVIAVMILAPLAAIMLKASVSRRREALADATAVAFTRNPTGLRRALERLASDSTVVRSRSQAVAHVWIESPLDGKAKGMLNTHPPLWERIAVLAAMEGQYPSDSPAPTAIIPLMPQPRWAYDPFGRFEHRYFDGVHWTDHVATAGRPYIDAPV